MSQTEREPACYLALRCGNCGERSGQRVLQFVEAEADQYGGRDAKIRCTGCGITEIKRLITREKFCVNQGHKTTHVRQKTIVGVVRGLFRYNTKWKCSVCGTVWEAP